jgi:multidrug resistance efflux pump
MKQLRKRPRLDNLRTEKRQRKGSVGRWIYLALLLVLGAWLFDLVAGDLLFFRAEGFVTQTRHEVSAPFTARVAELHVSEGETVEAGSSLAKLESAEFIRDISEQATRIADLELRVTELKTRAKVLEGLLPFASNRSEKARSAMHRLESREGAKLSTSQRVSQAAKEEFESMQELTRISAEYETVTGQLDQLDQALIRAKEAFAAMNTIYANGSVTAPTPGIVSTVPVARGSVVRAGEPLLEVLTGKSYVLAYTNPGTLYGVQPGDPVRVDYGLRTLGGRIDEILPITAALPKEFQRAFRPKERAQLIRIALDEGASAPPLLTKVEIRAASPLTSRLVGLLGPITQPPHGGGSEERLASRDGGALAGKSSL